MKTKRGETVYHKGKPWQVDKVLIPAVMNRKKRAYVRAFPISRGMPLLRSVRTIGDDWLSREEYDA